MAKEPNLTFEYQSSAIVVPDFFMQNGKPYVTLIASPYTIKAHLLEEDIPRMIAELQEVQSKINK